MKKKVKGIALSLVVLVALFGLSGCAALDAAHMAWKGAVIAGDLLSIPKVKAPAPKQASEHPSDPADPEAAERKTGDENGSTPEHRHD